MVENNSLNLAEGKYVRRSINFNLTGKMDPRKSIPYTITDFDINAFQSISLLNLDSIVKKHQGSLTIETKNNSQIIIHLYFPATEKNPDNIIITDQQANINQISHQILITCSDPDIAYSISQLLKNQGYQTEIIKSVDKLMLQIREQNTKKFYTIIIDSDIPG